MQGDLEARMRWLADRDRAELVELLAAAVPADVLRDAWAQHEESLTS